MVGYQGTVTASLTYDNKTVTINYDIPNCLLITSFFIESKNSYNAQPTPVRITGRCGLWRESPSLTQQRLEVGGARAPELIYVLAAAAGRYEPQPPVVLDQSPPAPGRQQCLARAAPLHSLFRRFFYTLCGCHGGSGLNGIDGATRVDMKKNPVSQEPSPSRRCRPLGGPPQLFLPPMIRALPAMLFFRHLAPRPEALRFQHPPHCGNT